MAQHHHPHQPTHDEVEAAAKAAAKAKEEEAETAAEEKAETTAKEEADAKAFAEAHPHLAPVSDKSLLGMLEGMGDDKSPVMHAIHGRLVEMRAFIDQAIASAEGELKAVLQALRDFIF